MIKVVRGNPTPEELAAAVAVLSAVRAPVPSPTTPARPTDWASRHRLLRTSHAYGTTGWLAPVLPG